MRGVEGMIYGSDVTGRGGVVDNDVTEALVVGFCVSGDDERGRGND